MDGACSAWPVGHACSEAVECGSGLCDQGLCKCGISPFVYPNDPSQCCLGATDQTCDALGDAGGACPSGLCACLPPGALSTAPNGTDCCSGLASGGQCM